MALLQGSGKRGPPLLVAGPGRRVRGGQISSFALPLVAVLSLRAGPARMGFLAALVWLPSLLFSIHAGVLADRLGHRRYRLPSGSWAQRLPCRRSHYGPQSHDCGLG